MIGANTPVPNRVKRLMRGGASLNRARALVARDMEESAAGGQKLQKTMQMADAFILLGDGDYENAVDRVFDLIFGAPFVTPDRDEHAMFLAFSASLRSASLSRQVGAALLDDNGELIGVGCNDVPAFGGGLYWPGPGDNRDHCSSGLDTNRKVLGEIIDDVADRLDVRRETVRARLKGAPIEDITEFGRAAHAEMEAILSAARSGARPRGGTLYTTTFPCHNCTRHIIASGVRRVVYVEPYPKSRARELHADAVW